jgi:hypothetical protein
MVASVPPTMDFMIRLAWLAAVPALAGCFLLPSGEASRVEEVKPELRQPRLAAPEVPDRHPYGDAAKVQVGQWARYAEGDRAITIAVVAGEGDDAWVEVIEEGEPRLASARLVAPDGVVKRAFYREIAKEGASAVVVQPLVQSAVTPVQADSRREAGEEKVVVGGRELSARVVRVFREDLDGRRTEQVFLWHPDVPPVYAGSTFGGLVRRTASTGVVQLLDFGTGARPLVEIPR